MRVSIFINALHVTLLLNLSPEIVVFIVHLEPLNALQFKKKGRVVINSYKISLNKYKTVGYLHLTCFLAAIILPLIEVLYFSESLL